MAEIPKESTSAVAPSPSMWARPVVTNTRLAVEVFDGTGHFGMWQSEVLDALFQQSLDIAIDEKKPDDMEEKDWKTINRLACGTIRSCLSREQRYAFSKETSANKLWLSLEEKFLKKNSQNKLHMKKRLFRFSYIPGTTMNFHITSFNQLVTDLVNMDESFNVGLWVDIPTILPSNQRITQPVASPPANPFVPSNHLAPPLSPNGTRRLTTTISGRLSIQGTKHGSPIARSY